MLFEGQAECGISSVYRICMCKNTVHQSEHFSLSLSVSFVRHIKIPAVVISVNQYSRFLAAVSRSK